MTTRAQRIKQAVNEAHAAREATEVKRAETVSDIRARLYAKNIAEGVCALVSGWCLTHDRPDSLDHHFSQPGAQGTFASGDAKND